jgi:hypothetical protein
VKDFIEKKTWEEFRETGLFLWINKILHTFGWVIVLEMQQNKVMSIFPARTKWRGFKTSDDTESYEKIAKYMKENAEELYSDIIE